MSEHELKRELYEKLLEGPELFEFLQAGSLDGVWYWDLEDPEREWMSPRFWEVLGHDPSTKEHLASEWQDLIFEEDLKTAIQNFELHCADPSHPYDQIVRYRHQDGSVVWVRCRGLAIRDADGKPIRMLGAHTNMTELMRAQEELQRSRDELYSQYEALAEASGELLFEWDPDSRTVRVGNLERILGCSEGTLDGPLEGWLDRVHPDDRERFEGEFAEAQERRRPFRFEYRARRDDGAYIDVEHRGCFFLDAIGAVRRMVGFVFDVTDRADATRSLERYASELERSNDDLDQFAYAASHDLKTPLRAVAHLAEWASEDARAGDADALMGHLDTMRKRVRRLDRLLDDLLAYSRVGRDRVESEPVDVAALLQDLAETAGIPADFEIVVDPGLPSFDAPRHALEQVFRNLIENAVKHHDRPSGRLEVSGTVRDDRIELRVEDDGPGIPEEFRERVFGLFKTLRPRHEVEGSGIGLTLVKKAVEALQGKIWIEGCGDRGTRVVFSWPLSARTSERA